METPLTVKPVTRTPLPVRPKPDIKGWVGDYLPGKGGDANLLIMFHGMGDNKAAYTNLAKQMQLPFTAVLSLQAPIPVPLMDTASFMWYPGFDTMFEPLSPSAADPSAAVAKLRTLITCLTADWAVEDIHMFGFGQGGALALGLALSVAAQPLGDVKRFGSVVSILSGLEGKQTAGDKSNTPVMYFSRAPSGSQTETDIKKHFTEVTVFRAPARGGMPSNMDEWRPIMGFWAKVLKRDDSWKGGEVYEVVNK